MSDLLAQLLDEAQTLTKAQFTARYPHAFLLCEINKLVASASPRIELISPATAVGTTSAKRQLAPNREEIAGRPNGFAALGIVKSDRNPWADRILVGRAKNNDVVLFNQSVSKVHACFTKAGSRHQLSAYQTLNPTLLGGKPLMPNAPGIDVADGAEIQFGTVSCRYFESASFHKLLGGRV